MRDKLTRHVCVGKYFAEVELIPERYPDGYRFEVRFPPDELRKLERVRLALMFGNVKGAAEDARVFVLRPVADDSTSSAS
jgi:hypothetical protein